MAGGNADISVQDGRKITAEAATWKGTPYSLVGGASDKGVGGDCSGSTYRIYTAAGFPYATAQSTAAFPDYAVQSGLFRKLGPDEAAQDGDVLSWSGHMAIYCTFYLDSVNADDGSKTSGGVKFVQNNDMWTAYYTGGPPYGPAKISWFKGGVMPTVYRYQKSQ